MAEPAAVAARAALPPRGLALSPAGGSGGVGGNGGAGAAAISGSNLTVINSGTLSPGLGGTAGVGGGGGTAVAPGGTATPGTAGGNGSAGPDAAAAIAFSGGVNVLELQQGSTITGNVVAVSGGSDTLRLGGSTNATFDASADRRRRPVPELRHPREDRQQQLDGDRRAHLHRRRRRHERDDDADAATPISRWPTA